MAILLFIVFMIFGYSSWACQSHMRPIYNATNKQYVSCNAWEPECASGTVCQLADKQWKHRLNVNSDYTLFLCCGDDGLSSSSSNNNNRGSTKKPLSPLDWETKTKYPFLPFTTHSTDKVTFSTSGAKTSPTLADNNLFNDHSSGSKRGSSMFEQAHYQAVMMQQQVNRNTARPTATPLLPPVPQIVLPGNGLKYDQPKVTQLIVGQLTEESADGTFKWSGTSTLVQDNGVNILVDTSSAQNKNKLLAALAQQGLKPQNIQILIYTNAHPAHMGNDNMFPYAEKIFATFVYKGDEWLTLEQFNKDPNLLLTKNVEIWQTPGRSELHNSVIVRNVPNQGSVGISGNIFLNEAQSDDRHAANKFAIDRELLNQVRNMIVCQVDYIIPAYGSPFVVNSQRKQTASCSNKRRVKVNELLRRS